MKIGILTASHIIGTRGSRLRPWNCDKLGLDKKNDYIYGLNYDSITRKDLDHLYLEIWKRVAKQKMDFNDALGEIYQQDMFPLLMGQIKLELVKHPPSSLGWMKNKYDTYMACIDEQAPKSTGVLTDATCSDYNNRFTDKGCPRQSLQYSKLKESNDAV
ncbi:hypothetical protein TRIUR3_12794 [Triticum urartu]|uniref:Uncharacterized protein n=1 Tax=Triticum urartu TaxID=4572 RepID=M7YXW8_TRIUA|nr:hypothetical protein TRIUR3_12794 [Triticum urartu]